MDEDLIERGLAAWGAPIFAPRPGDGAPRPPLVELLRACLESGRAQYRSALIPLLLCLPEAPARAAISRLREALPRDALAWLRWLTLAADYLSHVYRTELRSLLGRDPAVPVDLFERGILPSADLESGEWGLRALAEEIAATQGGEIDWQGSLEAPARDLIDALWSEGRAERAKSRHA